MTITELPDRVECRTCNDVRQVLRAGGYLDRCPDCNPWPVIKRALSENSDD